MACSLDKSCLFSNSSRDVYFFNPFRLVFRRDRGAVLTPTHHPLPSSSEIRNAWIYPLIFCRNNVICSLHDSSELNMIEEWMTSDFRKKSDTRHDLSTCRNWRKPFSRNSGFCITQNAGGFDTQVCQCVCANIGLEFFVSQHVLCGVLARCKTNIFDSCHFIDEGTRPGTFILKYAVLHSSSTLTVSDHWVPKRIILSAEERRISYALSNVGFVKYVKRQSVVRRWKIQNFRSSDYLHVHIKRHFFAKSSVSCESPNNSHNVVA